jgi:predicted CXXCH cytochrome family protein
MKILGPILCAVSLILAAPGAAAPKPPANGDCLACHEDPAIKRENGKAVLVRGSAFSASIHGQAGLSCVDCHADLATATDFPHKAHTKEVDCASCHEGAAAAHPFHPGLARKARGEGKAETTCASCHGSHEIVAAKDPASGFAPPKDVASCGRCHAPVLQRFLSSEHGRVREKGDTGRPTCLSCHRSAVTAGAGDLAALKKVQERLCVTCHLTDRKVRDRISSSPSFIAAYESSVHGAALLRGDSRAPTCIDCHGAHDMRRGFDSSSPLNKMRVQNVCVRCHAAEQLTYRGSIHGTALAKGNTDAPTCTDCHGEHSILSPKNPRSPVAAANVSARVCSPCHASLKLAEKWNLPVDRTQTFADSYHGLAAKGGVVEVANCASCHGSHDIRPSTDPGSRINRANLPTTCGASGCHPGANTLFAKGKVHVVASSDKEPLLYWIGTLYLLLIVCVVGGMLANNLLDFVKRSRTHLAIRRGDEFEPPAERGLYLRMTLGERLQHGALVISFTLLVITGFMLRYPDSWVAAIRRVSPHAFDLRSLVHRLSALVLVAASLYHLGYVIFTARGRQLVKDLWWRWEDAKDMLGVLRYNLGRSPTKPRFDRFSYVEKSEYWALVWGTVVMAATGFVMWFDNTFIGLLSKLGYDAARAVHFYEAWLATLAILVWHGYYVMLNPDTYPMNMSWLTGMLSKREMEEEHPLELERIEEASRKPAPEEPALKPGSQAPEAPDPNEKPTVKSKEPQG